MNIVIMRHGEAEMVADSDAARNLTTTGQSQAQAAGQFLRQLGFTPAMCWISPYQRTRQTAAAVLSAFDGLQQQTVPQQIHHRLTPDNRAEDVIQLLANNAVDDLLVVSHQPLVSSLVSLLVDGNLGGSYPMAPASMALLQTDSLFAGCCELSWLRHAPVFEVGG